MELKEGLLRLVSSCLSIRYMHTVIWNITKRLVQEWASEGRPVGLLPLTATSSLSLCSQACRQQRGRGLPHTGPWVPAEVKRKGKGFFLLFNPTTCAATWKHWRKKMLSVTHVPGAAGQPQPPLRAARPRSQLKHSVVITSAEANK